MHSLLNFLPLSVRIPVFYRLFSRNAASRPQLFKAAPLTLAPEVRMNLIPTDCGHQVVAYTGIYEWPVTKRIAPLAKNGGLLVDVGANAGYFSLLWCGLNKANTAEAFEALPANVGRLRQNIELNGMSQRVHLNDFALGKADGIVAFETGPAEQSGWGGIALTAGATTIEVTARRMDSVLRRDDRPMTVKTDCEGADSWVIEGAQEVLSSPQLRNVFFEVNTFRQNAMGIPHDASQKILQKLGFRCEQISLADWHAFKL